MHVRILRDAQEKAISTKLSGQCSAKIRMHDENTYPGL